MFKIQTRMEALRLGQNKYYTGKPCNKGHVTLRYCNTGACIDCIAIYGRKFREARPTALRVVIKLAHPQDKPFLQAYADALNLQRECEVSA